MFAEIARIFAAYSEGIARGLLVTLQLAGIAWGFGLAVGTALALLATRLKSWRRIVVAASFIFSSIPVLVLLFWVHYPLQAALGVTIPPFLSAAFVLALLNASAVARIVLHAMDTFDREYILAAVVCGLTPMQTFRCIQVPVFLRSVIPSLLRVEIGTLHMTLFASLISVDEIFRIAQRINAITYKPIEIFTALALLFLLVSLPLNWLAASLEAKFHGGQTPP